jgi:5-methylcytosine-specific restriction endonuclease McrBC regulatory subunit McrC
MRKPVLRLCEWGSVSTRGILTDTQREAIAAASLAWQSAHRLPALPLAFGGPRGERISARQYVGVVEAGGVCIEIYPKLDAALLTAEVLPDGGGEGVLRNLLWLLEVAGDDPPREADTAGLAQAETPFLEMFARLLARRLHAALAAGGGPARRYHARHETLHAVRGRVALREQVTRHWNRMDAIACVWDEFTPNTPLNQVLRCACRWLRDRIGGADTRRLLTGCLYMLDGVDDVSAATALQAARQVHHFDRTMERFRLPFELAHRLLSGTGPILQAGGAETFVFLVDMNDLFERYVHVVLEAAFAVPVRRQSPVWHLFPDLPHGRIAQKPDFHLTDREGRVWIGDSKYKHLARAQASALRFMRTETDAGDIPAGRLLSPDDVRQLTVYAELEHRSRPRTSRANLLLLYPYVGQGRAAADSARAWNGSVFTLAPIRLTPTERLAENFPSIYD